MGRRCLQPFHILHFLHCTHSKLLPLEAAKWLAHPMGLSYARHCECRLVASRQLLCTLLSSLPYCMSSGANGCKIAIVAGLGVLRRGEPAAFCAAQHATNVPQAKPRYPPRLRATNELPEIQVFRGSSYVCTANFALFRTGFSHRHRLKASFESCGPKHARQFEPPRLAVGHVAFEG